MNCLVTGVAGFIGSHLAEKLVADGHKVIGIDCFTDYYPRAIKQKNLANLIKQDSQNSQFIFIENNLTSLDYSEVLKNIDCIFHLAAQPGVRASWGQGFSSYLENNIFATQILLEAVKEKGDLIKFVYASSSSVYGEKYSKKGKPLKENALPKPVSPYGVTKLAGEHLCYLYYKSYSIPTIVLRYFTVYGPRQRPDMALHKFINAALARRELIIYGDGEQTRDFTYVADIVEGTISAAQRGRPGEVYNLGGGVQLSVNQIISFIEELVGYKVEKIYVENQKGDVRHTLADIKKANQHFGYVPTYDFKTGLAKQIEWQKNIMGL